MGMMGMRVWSAIWRYDLDRYLPRLPNWSPSGLAYDPLHDHPCSRPHACTLLPHVFSHLLSLSSLLLHAHCIIHSLALVSCVIPPYWVFSSFLTTSRSSLSLPHSHLQRRSPHERRGLYPQDVNGAFGFCQCYTCRRSPPHTRTLCLPTHPENLPTSHNHGRPRLSIPLSIIPSIHP